MARNFVVVELIECEHCLGSGYWARFVSDNSEPYQEPCAYCNGTGEIEKRVPLAEALKEFYVETGNPQDGPIREDIHPKENRE